MLMAFFSTISPVVYEPHSFPLLVSAASLVCPGHSVDAMHAVGRLVFSVACPMRMKPV